MAKPGPIQIFRFINDRAVERIRSSRYWRPLLAPLFIFSVGFILHLIVDKSLEGPMEELKIMLLYGCLPVALYFLGFYVVSLVKAGLQTDLSQIPVTEWEELSILPRGKSEPERIAETRILFRHDEKSPFIQRKPTYILYRVAVVSDNDQKGVSLVVSHLNPNQFFSGLETPLIHKDDRQELNPDGQWKRTFDLFSGQPKYIDVVQKEFKENQIQIRHVLDDVGRLVPSGRYRIRLACRGPVSGQKNFIVDVKANGDLSFFPEDDAVSREEYESLEKKLIHAEKHSPRILSEETEIALVKEFKQIGITEARVYLDARVDTTYSKPVAAQLIKVFKDAGCSVKQDQLFRTTCPIGRHPNDLWLDAGKEVKDQVKELLKKHGLSVSTEDMPQKAGTWVGIIVSIDLEKNQDGVNS